MSATPQDVLREAARILMRDGWTQFRFHDPANGTHCALGAIEQAHIELAWDEDEFVAETVLRNWLVNQGVPLGPSDSAAIWNDQPGVTAEDVILALKRAAEES